MHGFILKGALKSNKSEGDDNSIQFNSIIFNSILYYLCAEPTATRPITGTAQCRYIIIIIIITWHVDPLLSGDSVNSDRFWATAR
jgi:hypothetical protein